MECAINITYRCNSRCWMCNIWQNPSKKSEEFRPEILEKLPAGMGRVCIAGGEPMLRDDIADIVGIVVAKSSRPLISTNGYYTERIVEVCERYPQLGVRVSIEGLARMTDELRGISDDFDHALRTILRLKAMGRRDIGFAMVISDRNCHELLDVYTLCAAMGLEFSSATLHNSFYFHKEDNRVDDLQRVKAEMRRFIRALLTNHRHDLRQRAKDWARAYLNLGLLLYMEGKARPLPCGSGFDSFQFTPYGEVLACNGSAEPWVMGDLKTQSFEEIWHSAQAGAVREKVRHCPRNCWMTGVAAPAMQRAPWRPAWWALSNKTRLALRREVALNP